ncbi:MAG: HAD family hydrolase [Verrucomicrobia bacterium]|nr:HAD family hydrolase [Verrucomicrobiota bacterium]MCF7709522.1 HAD family hydrolase [Verrucomicrobiota bacterium]
MMIKIVFLDIYKTLLEVSPEGDPEVRWGELYRSVFDTEPRITYSGLSNSIDSIIAREHAAGRKAGIPYPEIFWPDVIVEALPELAQLSVVERNRFILDHISLTRSLRLMPAAAGVLKEWISAGIRLGIVSNAQPYTLPELAAALGSEDMSIDIFSLELVFWSFQFGFSKPDAHVFRILKARAWNFGIKPNECLVVGDRMDNDIRPASEQGFRVWQLMETPDVAAEHGGSWDELRGFIFK